MSEPIVEVTKVNLFGDYRDENLIVRRVRLDTGAYDTWLKEKEIDEMLGGYIEEKMERDFDDALIDNLAGVIGYAAKSREVRGIDGDRNK